MEIERVGHAITGDAIKVHTGYLRLGSFKLGLLLILMSSKCAMDREDGQWALILGYFAYPLRSLRYLF